MIGLKWHKKLLQIVQERQGKKIALVIDTSTNETKINLIDDIIKFFRELSPDTLLIEADFKIRSTIPITEVKNIKYFTHGKSSYTLVLEWGTEEHIDTLFYITDLTGFIHDELQIEYEIFWLVPTEFVPKAPFGKVLKIV
ncbi:VWA-like domain-containing protein [Cytobacillus sp. Hz8]|uniref:VWA-like domain-containing protein n=1 Tax=Cytobacillus sp. Hz8 TaxID=3347168 RepID=UPI0035DCA2D7